MSWLHLANDKMYDFSDKPTSRTTLSRCRLLARHKPRLGMQKEADPSDSSAKGIQLQHPSFRCIPLFWSPQTSVRSEVKVSALAPRLEIYCQDVKFWSLLMRVFLKYHKCLCTLKLCNYKKRPLYTQLTGYKLSTYCAPLKRWDQTSHKSEV